MMAAAGMTYRQILASLTTAPAEKCGESGRVGRIAPGLAADVVVLGIDPARDVRGFASVRYVLRDGKVIYRHQYPLPYGLGSAADSEPRP